MSIRKYGDFGLTRRMGLEFPLSTNRMPCGTCRKANNDRFDKRRSSLLGFRS